MDMVNCGVLSSNSMSNQLTNNININEDDDTTTTKNKNNNDRTTAIGVYSEIFRNPQNAEVFMTGATATWFLAAFGYRLVVV